MSKINDSETKGALLLATIGAIGFGLWAGSIGAGILAWVVLIVVISRVAR